MKLPPFEAVVADRLSVTFPGEDMPRIRELLDAHGAVPLDATCWRVGAGTVKVRRQGRGYSSWDFSGQVLAEVREADELGELLRRMAVVPHLRVASLDLAFDRPVKAAVEVPRVFRLGRRGELRVGRCVVDPCRVVRYDELDREGRASGGVYAPKMGRDVATRLLVYDKAYEVLCKTGEVIEPRTRYELRLRRLTGRASLVDAFSPASLFWAKLGNVLPRPAGVEPWEWREFPDRPEVPEMSAEKRLMKKFDAMLPGLLELSDYARAHGLLGLLAGELLHAMQIVVTEEPVQDPHAPLPNVAESGREPLPH